MVPRRARHARYALGAVAILVLAVSFETYRLVMPGQTWPGYAPGFSRTASTALIVVWAATAVAVLLRRKHRIFASLAWALAVMSPVLMVAHAAVTRVGGSRLGFFYVPAAIVLAFAMKRTLDRGERLFMPSNNPGGRPPEANTAYRLMPRPRH